MDHDRRRAAGLGEARRMVEHPDRHLVLAASALDVTHEAGERTMARVQATYSACEPPSCSCLHEIDPAVEQESPGWAASRSCSQASNSAASTCLDKLRESVDKMRSIGVRPCALPGAAARGNIAG